MKKHAPLVTKTIVQRPYAPWYTDDNSVQKTRRRQLERRLGRSQLPVDRCTFVDQCCLVKNLVFNAKMSSSLIHDAGTDSHALVKTIDRLLQRKPDKRPPYCSWSVKLANRFAAFFKVKIDNRRSELPDDDLPDYFAALDTPTYVKL